MTPTILCNECSTEKEPRAFPPSMRQPIPWRLPVCKECSQKTQKRSRQANPERHRDYRRQSIYGLSSDDVSRILDDQGHKCPGCLKTVTPDDNVDHCHASGDVRGILCRGCNLALGHVKDEPEVLERLAVYLRVKPKSHIDG